MLCFSFTLPASVSPKSRSPPSGTVKTAKKRWAWVLQGSANDEGVYPQPPTMYTISWYSHFDAVCLNNGYTVSSLLFSLTLSVIVQKCERVHTLAFCLIEGVPFPTKHVCSFSDASIMPASCSFASDIRATGTLYGGQSECHCAIMGILPLKLAEPSRAMATTSSSERFDDSH